MSPGDVRQLFRFVDWIMELPQNLERDFWQKITEYQEEKHMPFVTIAEQIGIEKGLQQGRLEGLLTSLRRMLERKFGEEGSRLMSEINQLQDPQVLAALVDTIMDASTPDEVRRACTQ